MIKLQPEQKYFIENNLLNFKPWEIIKEERLISKFESLKNRLNVDNLIPFAVRTDSDDVACFYVEGSSIEVVVIHDYSTVGWERREVFTDFWHWFNRAIYDLIEFAKDDIEYDLQKT